MRSSQYLGLLSISALVLASPALAREAAPVTPTAAASDDAGGLTDIIVTAQKRSENLQTTPIAISVFKGDDLANRHATSLVDLGDGAIPSLKVAPFFSRPGALIMNVRGIGVLSDSNQPARDQGVGIYIDGVYLGRPQGLGMALYDIENIEVLKGPQGTLFGRNTEGGAVNITTKKPSGQFKLNATGSIGNYDSYKGDLHLDLPEFANISMKIDAVISRRGPTVQNPLAGAEGFNSYDKRGVHIETLWKPSANFKADFSFDAAYDATSTLYFQQISAGVGATDSVTAKSPVGNLYAVSNILQPTRADVAVYGGPQEPSIGKSGGLRLGLDWQAGSNLTLKSITAYRWLTQSQFDNGSVSTSAQQARTATATFLGGQTATSFAFGRYSQAYFRQSQFSQELQAIGEFSRVKYVLGALYYLEKVGDNAAAFNTLQFNDAAGLTYGPCNAILVTSCKFLLQRASHVSTTSIGLFGQATYTPPIGDDIVHLTMGGRWTRDKKDGQLLIVNGALPVLPVNGVNVSGVIPLASSWSRIDPMVTLAVDATKDVHLYGKWSSGYRSGGANSRSTSYAKFDPETVSMFEIGLKSEFFDRKARLNLSAYTGTYKNIQLDFSGLYEDVINGVRVATTRTTTNTVNAPGTGKLKGFEAELIVAPVKGLTLSASYAYNSVKIPATINPFPQNGGVFITVPIPIYQVYTPEHSGSAALDYEAPMRGFTLKAHIDANFDSGYYANYTDSNYDSATRAVIYAQPKGDKSLVVNGRLGVADISVGDSGAKLGLGIWVRNMFDEQHLFYKSGSATSGISGFFNDPRTFGFDINVKL